MRRGTVFIIVFIAIAGGILALTQVFRSQPPLEVVVAVDPLAERWVRAAAAEFNARGELVSIGRRVRIELQVVSDMVVWGQNTQTGWTAESHPDGWIPAWSALFPSSSVGAGVTAQPLSPSLARTTLVWGSMGSAGLEDLSWDGVQAAADDGERIVFPLADGSVQGLGTLLSGAAHTNGVSSLSADMLNSTETRAWLLPVVQAVPNFNTVGPDVAVFMSGPQGSGYVAGIAAESQWLMQLGVLANRSPRFAYPDAPVMFDFPFYLLDSINQTEDERVGIRAFAEFLAQPAQQISAMDSGLRPASSEPPTDHPLFARGAPFGILPALSDINAVALPDQTSTLRSFLAWFGQNRR